LSFVDTDASYLGESLVSEVGIYGSRKDEKVMVRKFSLHTEISASTVGYSSEKLFSLFTETINDSEVMVWKFSLHTEIVLVGYSRENNSAFLLKQ
jgi:hypothetical protein